MLSLLDKNYALAIQIEYVEIRGNNIMQDSSESSGAKRRDRSRSQEKEPTNKLFITNIDGKADIAEVQREIRKMFEKYGEVESVVAKRNRNSEYCFAFAEIKDHQAAKQCVEHYDQSNLGGKQIKVEFQNDNKRRKDSNKGCYNCGKMGHFARECHASRDYNGRGGYHRRSRSPSEDSYRHRHKKHRKRHRSDSSERGRSRSPRSKKGRHRDEEDRKHRSRDRDEKRKKKHRHGSSDS